MCKGFKDCGAHNSQNPCTRPYVCMYVCMHVCMYACINCCNLVLRKCHLAGTFLKFHISHTLPRQGNLHLSATSETSHFIYSPIQGNLAFPAIICDVRNFTFHVCIIPSKDIWNFLYLTCFGLFITFNQCLISLHTHYMTLQHAVFPTQTTHLPHQALWTLQHAHTHTYTLR